MQRQDSHLRLWIMRPPGYSSPTLPRKSSMALEKLYSPKEVAEICSVSREKARLMIIEIMGDDQGMKSKNKGRGKRPYHSRRVPESLLQKYRMNFFNG